LLGLLEAFAAMSPSGITTGVIGGAVEKDEG
jgi:hypothetical protein